MRIEITKSQIVAIADLISEAESKEKDRKTSEAIKTAKEFLSQAYCVIRREDIENDTAERLRDFIQN